MPYGQCPAHTTFNRIVQDACTNQWCRLGMRQADGWMRDNGIDETLTFQLDWAFFYITLTGFIRREVKASGSLSKDKGDVLANNISLQAIYPNQFLLSFTITSSLKDDALLIQPFKLALIVGQVILSRIWSWMSFGIMFGLQVPNTNAFACPIFLHHDLQNFS